MEAEINIAFEIERLLNYGLNKKLIQPANVVLIRNELMEMLNAREAYEGAVPSEEHKNPSDILNNILRWCFETGILTDNKITRRDLLSAKVMGTITPPPSEVINKFNSCYENSPMEATDYLYSLSCDVNYIHTARAKKNVRWTGDEKYGHLEFTINFQSPEMTESEIADRESTEKNQYPKCEKCSENVGFPGNLWHKAGQNLRVVPIMLRDRTFYLEFPHEQHYNERCFLVSEKHEPMSISIETFEIILDFVDMFPHCFMGFEAELAGLSNHPNVHEFYQGGCAVFPIEYAEKTAFFHHDLIDDVEIGILNWPVSVIRAESSDPRQLAHIADIIREVWSGYSDENAGIFAHVSKDGARKQHNAIAAVARKNARGIFEMDIFLRNNAESFVPRPGSRLSGGDVGLTEGMGLAVYPEKFDNDLLHVMSYLMRGRKYEKLSTRDINKHSDWVNSLVTKYGVIDSYQDAKNIVCFEVARRFAQVLDGCGVFKLTETGQESFKSFMYECGFVEELEDL